MTHTSTSRQFSDEKLKEIERTMVFINELNDASFGPIRVYRRADDPSIEHPRLVMEKTALKDEKMEFAQLYQESQARLSLRHPNLLSFLGFDFLNAKDFCSTQMQSRLFFEYESHDLAGEIARRAEQQVRR